MTYRDSVIAPISKKWTQAPKNQQLQYDIGKKLLTKSQEQRVAPIQFFSLPVNNALDDSKKQ